MLLVLVVFFVAVGCVNGNGKQIPPATLQSVPTHVVEYTAYGDSEYVTIYLVESNSNYIVPTSVRREADDSPLSLALSVLNGELQVPNFRGVAAPQAFIEDAVLADGVITLNMPASFQSWVMRNLAEERNFIQATVLTLTSFKDITSVRFLANGRDLFGTVFVYSMDRPIPRPQIINSSPESGASVVLYLRLRGTNVLVPYTKTVERRDPLLALNELLRFKGHDTLASPIPGGITIKGLRVDDGTAYLNLDKSAVTHIMQGTLDEHLVLDSLVHTLIEFQEIRQVQILVDGRVLGPLSNNVDLSRAIGRTPINKQLLP